MMHGQKNIKTEYVFSKNFNITHTFLFTMRLSTY